MAEYRFGRGWTETELEARLEKLARAGVNFDVDPWKRGTSEKFFRYYSEALIGREEPGPVVKGGAFEKARSAIEHYEFSDPSIVRGHFECDAKLLGRKMLLEIQVLGLRYLCGVEVGATRWEPSEGCTVFGFRYDTLEGHFEIGSEWFLLTKKHETGELWFRIQAAWHEGQFPNWWSRAGFAILGRRYQRAWHRIAYQRLRAVLGSDVELQPIPAGGGLFHSGPEIELSLNPLTTTLARVQQAASPVGKAEAGISVERLA